MKRRRNAMISFISSTPIIAHRHFSLLHSTPPKSTSLPLADSTSRRHRQHSPTAILHKAPKSPSPSSLNPSKSPQSGEPGHRFFDYSPERIESVRIRHILVDTEDLCNTLHTSILSNTTTLSSLASTISLCHASRISSGDIGWWRHDDLIPTSFPGALVDDTLLTAALSSRPHTLSKVQSIHGWHLFVVEDARHKLLTTFSKNASRLNPNQLSRRQLEDVALPIKGTYALQTLGCQMNRSDSERMAGALERAGYKKIDDAFRASLLVLNTCNIREHAEKKVYSYLGRHAARKRKFPTDITLAVAGCVAQQEGERMLRRVPELDLVFGPQYVNRLDELLNQVKDNGCQVSATEPAHIVEDVAKPRRESRVTAWINIIYGCGENCTFCTVGNVVRTVEQSRSMEAIKKEIETVAQDGVTEIVLLGQNIDAYGRDMIPKKTFAQLMRYIHDVDGIERIRFTTSHPRYISENLVKTCAVLPKVMPFFHIPPQSGDSDILKAMRRGYSVETFRRVVDRIRKYIPDAAISGDMIVGFPGETEEQFERSLKLIEEIGFDVMNTAAYSPRPKTPAAEFENQIEENVKSDRLKRMNEVVTKVAMERSLRYEGRVEDVLVENENPKKPGEVIGRTPTNRTVYFKGKIEEIRGQIVGVKILKAFPFSLQGEYMGDIGL